MKRFLVVISVLLVERLNRGPSSWPGMVLKIKIIMRGTSHAGVFSHFFDAISTARTISAWCHAQSAFVTAVHTSVQQPVGHKQLCC